ncbi:MAG: SLBB domain-containing protein [Candidatus Latescibacteria bacterium]|nr:SLBB domain-containing protein [Candidatus Latescibacterota bacterium]
MTILWVLCVVSFVGCASRRVPPSYEAPTGPLLLPGPLENRAYTEEFGTPEYLIGSDDVLGVFFLRGDVEERQAVTVQVDGMISLPYLPDLHVGGLTPRQADSLITVKASVYVKNPSVDVRVEVYNSKKVIVLGAVGGGAGGGAGVKSGEQVYALQGKTRLLDVISQFGGMYSRARGDRISIVRGGHVAFVDLRRVWAVGDTTQNPVLEGGDIIYVPWGTEKRVFVTGEIQNPGIFLLSYDTTVLEAIMQAGGFTDKAMRDDVKIMRGGNAGSPIVISVDTKEIIDRGNLGKNLTLEHDDVIYVRKSVSGSLVDKISRLNAVILPSVTLGLLFLRL